MRKLEISEALIFNGKKSNKKDIAYNFWLLGTVLQMTAG